MMSKLRNIRKVGETINFGGMVYAPVNELGVVCLFGAISKLLGYQIESIHPRFPDCTAFKQGIKKDIEFEYKSKNAFCHFKKGERCDVIVCWEDNWVDKPKGVEILELKRYVGQFRKIWFFSVGKESWEKLDKQKKLFNWTCLPQSSKGDIVLWWRTAPDSSFRDIWVITSEVRSDPKLGCVADMKLIKRLKTPLKVEHIKEDIELIKSNFVRSNFRKPCDVTRYWADIYRLISHLNPELKKPLLDYFSFEPKKIRKNNSK